MKRGRPKKDYSHLRGQQFNQLKIVAMRRNDRTGHPMCRTKCLRCKKKMTTQRIHDVVKGSSKTCGCASKQAFKDFMDGRVAALTDKEIERIWRTVQDLNTRAAARAL
jgi:hypothetical protein